MKWKPIIVVTVFVLAIVGAYFGLSSLSTIESIDGDYQSGDKINLMYSCDVPQDCIDTAIENNNLYPESVNDFKNAVDVRCESGSCWGYVR